MSPDNSASNKINLPPSDPRSTFKYPATNGDELPWRYIIPKHIKPQIDALARRGLKPTIRGMLYYLESTRVMPKNDNTYDRLVKAMSSARKGRKKRDGTRGDPTIAIDAFADNTRHIIKDFKDEERSLRAYINDGIVHFQNLPNGFKTLVPRWLDQPNYVEYWLEKDAQTDNIKKILEGRDVVIVPNRGNTSIPFFHDNVERLAERFNNNNNSEDVHVYVFYLGDLDPAGWAMDNYIQKELSEKCSPWSTFRRIGITEEQIINAGLEHLLTPTPDVLAKLSNPKFRASKPFLEHFGRLFQVELDAMELMPNFEKLITHPVDKLFDQDIHDEVLARPEYSQSPNVIKEQIKEALYDMIGEFNAEDDGDDIS